MPPPGKSKLSENKENKFNFTKLYKKYVNFKFLVSLFFDPEKLPIISIGILLAELVLNIFVVRYVNYTEIDWRAYMQQCEGFLNGTTNYALLKGATGPIVYPSGYLYFYSVLYFITSRGQNIRLAQYIFIFIYLLQMHLVLRLYCKSRRVPPYVLIICAFTSYRIHSIYVLRLFNDPIAVLFLYLALNLFVDRKWYMGSIAFSLGVSIKMNILLFAPALLLFYITNLGYVKTAIQLFVCAAVQLILGAPFLLTYPQEYIKNSFNLGRIFEHKWTVNYRFLDRDTFEDKYFHIGLLIVHVLLLAVYAKPCFNYFQSYCRLRQLEKQLTPQITAQNKQLKDEKAKPKAKKVAKKDEDEKLSEEQQQFLNSFEKGLKKNPATTAPPKKIEEEPEVIPEKYSIHFDQCIQLALLPFFLSNLIGLVCARSLHYQFYVWYFHSLPYLAWCADYRVSVRFLILLLIEFCWNQYPSTIISSILLHVCHIALLLGISRNLFKKIPTSIPRKVE